MKIVKKNFVQEGILDLVSYRGCRTTYRSSIGRVSVDVSVLVVRDGNGSVSVMYR